VNKLNLEVKRGQIFGMLGPNGSGKTTTLGMLMGVVNPTAGDFTWFGEPPTHDTRKKIGAVLEHPIFYPYLTGQKNLELNAMIKRCSDKRIPDVLELVELTDRRNDRYRTYSLGMKQRLAIASALLNDPEILILDEPTNGLDPNGIIETRELLKKLNKEHGTTVLVSSHILNEVERMATHVGIIHKGVMLFQGTLTDLHHLKKEQACLEIETSDNAKAAALLQELFPVQQKTDKILLPAQSQEITASINRMLLQKDIDVYSLHQQQNDLEQLFIDITSNHK